ncbi:MAG: hypothetical protein U1E05_13200 [Patescibacteria group bacterium]|nr:hypothetical protein [Patescibacteria group bacterium]
MRRITVALFAALLLCSPGCHVVRDTIFGGLAEQYDTSRHPSDRRAAYDGYIRENVDK